MQTRYARDFLEQRWCWSSQAETGACSRVHTVTHGHYALGSQTQHRSDRCNSSRSGRASVVQPHGIRRIRMHTASQGEDVEPVPLWTLVRLQLASVVGGKHPRACYQHSCSPPSGKATDEREGRSERGTTGSEWAPERIDVESRRGRPHLRYEPVVHSAPRSVAQGQHVPDGRHIHTYTAASGARTAAESRAGPT